MAGNARGTRKPTVGGRQQLIGARIRVVARRGYVVEGMCLDAWNLRSGGVALKIKPTDGSAPREVTTLAPVVVLAGTEADAG